MQMLDVGCGWGSLSLHAAEHFGAHVTGVTIAAEQKRFIDARIVERGLQERVGIRLQDYREVPERDHYDAVGSLEMGEHVGEGNYPTYVEVLRRAVRPGGRVLVQQMSRTGDGARGRAVHRVASSPPTCTCGRSARRSPTSSAGDSRSGTSTRCVSTTCGRCRVARHLRGHLPALAELVGEEVVRVWRLYLVGGMLAFRDGRMGVDQMLCVRPGADHSLPPVRAW